MTVQPQTHLGTAAVDAVPSYTAAGVRFSLPFEVERRMLTVNSRRVDVFGAVEFPFSMSIIRRNSPFVGDLAQPGLCGLISHGWRSRWGATNHEARQFQLGPVGKAVLRQFDSTSAERQRIWVIVLDDGQEQMLVAEAISSIVGGSRGGVGSWVHEFLHSLTPAEIAR